MVETAQVKYVYLDVVSFTNSRSVEAQSDIVQTLNDVTRSALSAIGAPIERTILIPTGDGLAVAMLNEPSFDIHLKAALEMLKLVAQANEEASEPMRRFEVRIGLNENFDNVVVDVNGRRNVAGLGISMAQRIMDKADGGQVLVGSPVYETLRQREVYMSKFRAYDATGKHGIAFSVYQYLDKDARGLNVSEPSAFAAAQRPMPKFTKLAAYFVAHATQQREFLFSRRADPVRDYAATLLLFFLAQDSVEKSETAAHDVPTTKTWKAGVASYEEQYEHYYKIDFWALALVEGLLTDKHLRPYRSLFEASDGLPNYCFLREAGIEKLRTEWPSVAEEFGLSQTIENATGQP